MSRPLKRSVTAFATDSIPSRVLTSACTKRSAEVSGETDRAVAITSPPPRIRRSTMASPMPLVPPVTRIRLPLNSVGSTFGWLSCICQFPLSLRANPCSDCCGHLPFDERQQVGIDLVCIGSWHAVRETRIELRRGVFEQLCRQWTSICERHDLVILAMHHQRWYFDLLEILGEISFRECFDTVVLRLDPAHHALPPPVIPYTLRDLCSRPVVTIEGKCKVLVILGSVLTCAFTNLVENFDRKSAGILVGLDHDWWDRANQHCLRDSSFAVSSHIARHLSAARRMTDVNRITKVELFNQLVHVSCVGVHLVTRDRLC